MTRGERNCNPTNIKRVPGQSWYGERVQQTDPVYVEFQSAVLGLRAPAIILRHYGARGLNTPTTIVDTWAPPVENDSTAYVQDFCERTGFGPGQILDMTDQSTIAQVLRGIIYHENGAQPYSDATIEAGVAMAFAKEIAA